MSKKFNFNCAKSLYIYYTHTYVLYIRTQFFFFLCIHLQSEEYNKKKSNEGFWCHPLHPGGLYNLNEVFTKYALSAQYLRSKFVETSPRRDIPRTASQGCPPPPPPPYYTSLLIHTLSYLFFLFIYFFNFCCFDQKPRHIPEVQLLTAIIYTQYPTLHYISENQFVSYIINICIGIYIHIYSIVCNKFLSLNIYLIFLNKIKNYLYLLH